MESLTSGTLAGTGSFRCEGCGYVVTLAAGDSLPQCPSCDGRAFSRASMFEESTALRSVETELATAERSAWLAEARERVDAPGQYLVFDDGGELRTVPPRSPGTTRSLRSGASSRRGRQSSHTRAPRG